MQFTSSGYVVFGDINSNFQPLKLTPLLSPSLAGFSQAHIMDLFVRGSDGSVATPDRFIFAAFWGKFKVNISIVRILTFFLSNELLKLQTWQT